MTPKQRQEEISKAYLHAVAAKSGFAVGSWSQDHGGVDTTVGAAATVEAGHLARPKVDVQLKATTQQHLERGEYLSWQLDIEHYDSLRAAATLPHLLVVLLLPEDVEDSVEHTAAARGPPLWLLGEHDWDGGRSPRAEDPDRAAPKTQMFSPDALNEILEKVSKGEMP